MAMIIIIIVTVRVTRASCRTYSLAFTVHDKRTVSPNRRP